MPPRLSGWDYGAPGAYFITVCTYRRRPFFGTVDSERVLPSPLGSLAHTCLSGVVSAWPDIALETSVVMPDHVHLLIQRDATDLRPPPVDRLIRHFKASLTHEARRRTLVEPRANLWQRGFFDRVIRTVDEHAAMRAYIDSNPLRWTLKRVGTST